MLELDFLEPDVLIELLFRRQLLIAAGSAASWRSRCRSGVLHILLLPLPFFLHPAGAVGRLALAPRLSGLFTRPLPLGIVDHLFAFGYGCRARRRRQRSRYGSRPVDSFIAGGKQDHHGHQDRQQDDTDFGDQSLGRGSLRVRRPITDPLREQARQLHLTPVLVAGPGVGQG